MIFSADNGPERYAYARDERFDHWSAKPFRGLKRDIYEGGHHVPFLIRWPTLTKPHSVCDALVSQVDIVATLADYLNFDLPRNAAEDSHSLLPLLQGAVKSVRSTHVHNTRVNEYALRDGDWLLIDAKDGYVSKRNKDWEAKHDYPADDGSAVELYNLADDIGQRTNVASQHPDRVVAMRVTLKRIREQGYSAPRLASGK